MLQNTRLEMKILPFLFIAFASTLADEYLQSNIHFAADVYKELAKTTKENFLVCPLSAHTILSLMTLGAKKNTAKQLITGLNLPEDFGKIEDIFRELSANFEIDQPYQFTSANRIFLDEGYTITKTYKDIAVNIFKSDIENINFVNSEKAAQDINKWVESKTHNKITNLVQKETLTPDTILVLVNAIYFHGFWLHEFGKTFGYKSPFHVTKTVTVDVEMVTGRSNFNYYDNKNLKTKFLELPFVGNDVTMTFALPYEVDGLSALENHISEVVAQQPYTKTDVMLNFPKFKMETNVDFKSILRSLGVTEAFTAAANFQGMSDSPLFVSEVIQKTFIEVNERGATAAAATYASAVKMSMLRAAITINHPFIFYLRHKINGVFFVGRYTKPE